MALSLKDIILEEAVVAGDKVAVFHTPSGKHFVSKDPGGFLIEKITSAYLVFDSAHIQTEEK